MDRQRNVGSIIEIGIESKARVDQARLLTALQDLVAEDATLRFSVDPESGQVVLGGQDERHLREVTDKLSIAYGLAIAVGSPQVSYRERLTRTVDISHTYSKQTGAAGEFARLQVRFEPSAANSGFEFATDIANDALLDAHIAGIKDGLEAARENGVLAGFPVIDFRATLTNGAYHEVDSNRRTFDIAIRQAFLKLRDERAIELVEPILAAEITSPSAFAATIARDLNVRRGQVMAIEQRGEASIVRSLVPASSMVGYPGELQKLTHGEGSFSTTFSHYEAVPRATDDDPRFPPRAAMRA